MLHSSFKFFKFFQRSGLRDNLVVSHHAVEILINISLREDVCAGLFRKSDNQLNNDKTSHLRRHI